MVSHVTDDVSYSTDDANSHGQPHVSHIQAVMHIGQSAVQTECDDRERQDAHVSVSVAHEQTCLTRQSVQTNPQISVLAYQLRRPLLRETESILDRKKTSLSCSV